MQRPMRRKQTLTPESRFNKAPPGFSLTGSPKKWPWEGPPEHTSPGEAVDAIIDNLEKPEVEEQYVQLLAAGVSVEELVSTMTKVGFTEGRFTVDVAELIKAPLAFYLMGLAAEYQIPAKVFNTKDGLPRTNYGMEDAQLLNIMKDRNPEFAAYMMKRPEVNDKVQRETAAARQQSFLADMPTPPAEEAPGIDADTMEEEEK